jgi:hypothetical protein
VARNPEQTHRPTQLPCSCFLERMNSALNLKIEPSSASFRLNQGRPA